MMTFSLDGRLSLIFTDLYPQIRGWVGEGSPTTTAAAGRAGGGGVTDAFPAVMDGGAGGPTVAAVDLSEAQGRVCYKPSLV